MPIVMGILVIKGGGNFPSTTTSLTLQPLRNSNATIAPAYREKMLLHPRWDSGAEVIESNKCPSISVSELPHQGGKANTGCLQMRSTDKLNWETDCVNTDQMIPLLIHAVNATNNVHHLSNGTASKFITEDEDTNFLPRVVK